MMGTSDSAEPDTVDEAGGAQEPAERRHHTVVIVLAVVGTIILIAVGSLVLTFVTREDPQAHDVTDAVEEYQATSVPTSALLAEGPRAGVYQAEGEGREELSFPPLHQDDGTSMPMTVEHLPDDCWRIKVDFNEAHWQSWDYCPDEGTVLEVSGQTFQRWDLGATTIENLSDFTCDPPGVAMDGAAEPGSSWPQSCTGTNTAIDGSTVTAGPYTFVGADEIEIGGEGVAVQHYLLDRTLTGAQEGTNKVDLWFTADGLPVRMERTVEVATASPVGDITYEESGNWQLTSLEPIS